MVAGPKYNQVRGSDEQTYGSLGGGTAVDDDDLEPVTLELPPKQAGEPLGIGLSSAGGSCLDPVLSFFVEVPPPQLMVAQISPESPVAGLLNPGDVIYSINGIGGEACMTADAASTYIRSATKLKFQVLPPEVAKMVQKERYAAVAPRRLLALGLLAVVVFAFCGCLVYASVIPWLRLRAAKKELIKLQDELLVESERGKKALQTTMHLSKVEHDNQQLSRKLQVATASRESLERELAQVREHCQKVLFGQTGANPASTAFLHHNKALSHADQCASSDSLAWIRSGDHKKLEAIMMGQHTDKARHRRYQEMYFRVLEPIARRKCLGWTEAERTIRILEVGLGCEARNGPGGSVAVWKELFVPPLKLDLHVMEYDSVCSTRWSTKSSGAGTRIHVGNQNSTADLDRVYAETGGQPFDLIVDDGSHLSEHQYTTAMRMIGRVAQGGAYIIEDLHTSCYNYSTNGRARNIRRMSDAARMSESPRIKQPSNLRRLAESNKKQKAGPVKSSNGKMDQQHQVAGDTTAIGRIFDCMRTKRGSLSMYAHLSDWQTRLIMGHAPLPELAPSVKHISLWPTAAVIELSTGA